jgi:hypothetical protein
VVVPATTARGARLGSDLFDANVEVHRDLVRNIPGIRRSQDLFDDLSDDPDDWAVAVAAESAGRIETDSAAVTRPFDYGTVITYTFESAHWQAYAILGRHALWRVVRLVGHDDDVYERLHWSRFVRDSFGSEDRAIRSERRGFDVRCDALLIDLRGKEKATGARRPQELYVLPAVGSQPTSKRRTGVLAVLFPRRADGVNAGDQLVARERLRDRARQAVPDANAYNPRASQLSSIDAACRMRAEAKRSASASSRPSVQKAFERRDAHRA